MATAAVTKNAKAKAEKKAQQPEVHEWRIRDTTSQWASTTAW